MNKVPANEAMCKWLETMFSGEEIEPGASCVKQ